MSYRENLEAVHRQTAAILQALTDLHGAVSQHMDRLPLEVSNALLQCNKKLEEALAMDPDEIDTVRYEGDNYSIDVSQGGD